LSDWKGHMQIGVVVGIILTVVLIFIQLFSGFSMIHFDIFGTFEIGGIYIPIIIIAFVLLVYASILPDIDIGTSKAYQWTTALLLLLAIAFIVSGTRKFETIAILVFLFLILFLNHRGITHKYYKSMGIIAGLFFSYIFGLNVVIFFYVTIGYYAHLLGDR